MTAERHIANIEQRALRDLELLKRVSPVRRVPAVVSTDTAPDDAPGTDLAVDSEGKPRKQSDVLVDIGRSHDLFHAPDGTAYARVGKAVVAVDSTDYRELLAERFLSVAGRGANRNSIGDAVNTLASIAKFRGDQRDVFLRTARVGDAIVIDTGRADRRVIEVTATGWRLGNTAPMFRRTAGMAELPEPAEPDFSRLWRHVNVAEIHRPLVAGWLLAALRPDGPCPIVFLSGEQGTGKSTAARLLRSLVDPSSIPLRAPPKDTRDLLVGALNGWALVLDNLSTINPQLSDALCRVATGGAISERKLFTNTEETLIEVKRPVIVNGIEDLATRPDLAERGLHVELEVIQSRKTEAEIRAGFKADAPHIFGALLRGLTAAIRDHRHVEIGNPPRMADFAKWAAAGVGELGFSADAFITAYRDNLAHGMETGIDGSPVGEALVSFMRSRKEWIGTASELAKLLTAVTDDVGRQSWPRTPRGLAGCLRRLAPALRLQGIEVDKGRTGSARNIRLCNTRKQPSRPSFASLALAGGDGNDANDDLNHGLHDVEVIEL